MFNSRGEFGHLSVLRAFVFLAFACSAALCAEPAKESTSNLPKVTAVLQLTHDGISKGNLVSDDTDLYVTESPASGHVLTKLSSNAAERVSVPAELADAQ